MLALRLEFGLLLLSFPPLLYRFERRYPFHLCIRGTSVSMLHTSDRWVSSHHTKTHQPHLTPETDWKAGLRCLSPDARHTFILRARQVLHPLLGPVCTMTSEMLDKCLRGNRTFCPTQDFGLPSSQTSALWGNQSILQRNIQTIPMTT